MTRRIIGTVLLLAIVAIVGGNFTTVAASAPLADAQAVTLVGGMVDCGTLAGATAAAAFLAGFGAISLLGALVGGAGLVAFC
jgi:hypothetical protein